MLPLWLEIDSSLLQKREIENDFFFWECETYDIQEEGEEVVFGHAGALLKSTRIPSYSITVCLLENEGTQL